MKPVVLFDIGTVLVELDFSRLLNPLSQELGDFQKWIPYDAFERGQITEADFLREVNQVLKSPLDTASFLKWWNSILIGPVPGVPELLRELEKNTRLFGLTNTSLTHWHYLKENYRWLDPLTEIFASFHFGMRKPESEIYLQTCERMGTKPSEVLFIDDRSENVEAARAVGMMAHHSSGSLAETRAICAHYKLCTGI